MYMYSMRTCARLSLRSSKRRASAAAQRLCVALGTCFDAPPAPAPGWVDGGAVGQADAEDEDTGAEAEAEAQVEVEVHAASSARRSRRNAPTICQSFTCHLTRGAKPANCTRDEKIRGEECVQ